MGDGSNIPCLKAGVFVQDKYDKNKQIELDDIGNIAQQHSFKAVYVEGIRGGHPYSELLVFDPKNLKLIREEKP